jgi:ubiquinone/menaquinone biosynthesis C-methylase UbiE
MTHDIDRRIAAEGERIVAEYRRRDDAQGARTYDSSAASVSLERVGRRRCAETALRRAGVFPGADSLTLEVGCGAGGWSDELLEWGVSSANLHGIDLIGSRIADARAALPGADLRVGNAAALPWDDAHFHLVVASTVFTSMLDDLIRRSVAREIARVLAPGGALLWYDFAVNNPRNPHVRKVTRREVRALFPTLSGELHPLTLAPPVARLVAPISERLAAGLAGIRLLQTHLLAVLVKPR